MQVELLLNGGYTDTGKCVGKVFEASQVGEGYGIGIMQLTLAGYEDDGSITTYLYFLPHEVRVIDGN